MTSTPQKSQMSTSVLGFVPALVVQHFLKTHKQKRQLPEKQSIESVVMFADISGFTNLTETLSKIGYEGAEIMAFAINRYMELLIKSISRSGGDIFKFAGDAMIVIWPPPEQGPSIEDPDPIQTLTRQAIQSAMDIQDKLNDTNILDKIKLSVKVGFGVGKIDIIYVGGIFDRCEYLATGDPLIQAFESEHHAKGGGETIVSRLVYEKIKDFFEFSEIKEEHPEHKSSNSPFYHIVHSTHRKVRMKADALKIKNNLTQAQFELIKPQIKLYIPAALQPYIEIDQEPWSAELRKLTIMFVNLGIDLGDAKSDVGLKRIQRVIETVQRCVYYHQGSVNKLLMDDKGSTLIVVFGLPPLSHQDDPIRAILTGFSLLKELECACSIGIASGVAFAGVVGTSGSRREYSVLGDCVNLSARLMQLACGEETKKIICCEQTATGAQQKMLMKFYKFVKLKGKEKELPVFEPLNLSSEELKQITKVELFYDIKTHLNSLIVDDKVNLGEVYLFPYQRQMIADQSLMQRVIMRYFQMVGRQTESENMLKLAEDFLKNPEKNKFLMLRGGYGVGKSLFLRVLLNKIKLDEPKYIKEKDSIIFLTSALGPMQKTLKFNGMRPLFQQLFILIAKKQNTNPNESFFNLLLPKTNENQEFYDFFLELVGIKQNNWIDNFPFPKDPPSSISQINEKNKLRKKVQNKFQAYHLIFILFVQWVFNLAILIFNHFAESNQQNSESRRQSNKSFSSSSNSNKYPPAPIQLKPLIIVFEDFHLFDHETYCLIKNLLHYFSRLCILATVRDQYNEVQRKFEQAKTKTQDQVFLDGLNSIEDAIIDDYTIIELKPLKRTQKLDELRALIKMHFNVDQFIFEKPENSITQKAPHTSVSQKLSDHLLFFENKPYLLASENADLLILPYFYLRTMGNPLSCINFIDNLIKVKYLYYSDKTPTIFIVSESFRQAMQSEETLNIEAPVCWVQVNGPIIDSLTCLESLVLKVASVAGDIFDNQTLNRIQPFKDILSSEKLIKILQDLIAQDAIEILDVSDINIYYRFTHPFMREVLYQRMTYNHRRLLHRAVAEALQTMNYPFGDLIEQKKLEFHWQQAEQRWNQPAESEKFSHKAKRSIIVKQIQQVLSQARNETMAMIKFGHLEKKSDSNISWAPRYILLTSRDFRYYYTEQDYRQNVDPLGVIQLKNIFGIYALNQKEIGNKKWAFQMQASSWMKKTEEMPLRTFYFAAQNEDVLEEWSIYLEFSKAKAIYDDFVNNFGKISFPLGSSENQEQNNIRIDFSVKQNKINLGWGQTEGGGGNKSR